MLQTMTFLCFLVISSTFADQSGVADFPLSRFSSDYLELPAQEISRANTGFRQGGLIPDENQFTISFWIHYQGPTADLDASGKGEILKFGTAFQVTFESVSAERGIDLKVRGPYNNDRVLTSPSLKRVIVPNEWVHLTFVFSPSDFKFYQNGRLAASESITWGALQFDEMSIGRGHYPENLEGSSVGFQIENLALFRRALMPSEIAQLYSSPDRPGSISDLIALWQFDSGFRDSLRGYQLVQHNRESPIRIVGSQLPSLAFDLARPQVCFETADEQTLYNYVVSLNTEPQFNVRLESVVPGELETARGKWGALYTSHEFQLFSDYLKIPSTEFVHVVQPDQQPPWRLPVQGHLLIPSAYFYSVNESWNPYSSNRNYPFRTQIRNRIAINAIAELLFLSRFLNEHRPEAHWMFRVGFRLLYSAYTCSKICSEMGEAGKAWYRTLDRALRLMIARSAPDNHSVVGTNETDMNFGGLLFLQELRGLDGLLEGTLRSIELHDSIIDEWMKLLVDIKTKAQSKAGVGTLKGFISPGYCLMDQTVSAQYNGLCEDHLANLMVRSGQHRQRLSVPINLAAQLAYYHTLYDSRAPLRQRYISPQGFNGRHNTTNSFAMRAIHRSYWSLWERMDSNYHEIFFPLVWRDFLEIYDFNHREGENISIFATIRKNAEDRSTVNFLDATNHGIFNRFKVQTELYLQPEPVLNEDESPDIHTAWGTWLDLNVVEYMTREDLLFPIEQEFALTRYPSQNTGTILAKRSFGESDQPDFHIIQKGKYTATLYTGKSLANDWKGGGGSGIGSIQVRLNTDTSLIPFKDGYLGDYERTGLKTTDADSVAAGKCIDINGTEIRSLEPNDPDCIYLKNAGRYDWRDWVSHSILGIPDPLGWDPKVMANRVYNSHYYDVSTYRSEEIGETTVIETETPFGLVFDYLRENENSPHLICSTGQGSGACLRRRYEFSPSNIGVKSVVDGFSPEARSDFSVNLRSWIYDTIPVFYAGQQFEPDDEFFSSAVHFCQNGIWKRAFNRKLIDNVTKIEINQSVSPWETRLSGGIIIHLDRKMRIRLDTKPVAYGTISSERMLFSKNLLLEMPRFTDGHLRFENGYTITPKIGAPSVGRCR